MDDDANQRLMAFQQGDRWGFKKPDGAVAVSPVFEEVGEFSYGLCPVRRNRLWGAINEAGDLQVPHAWFRKLHFRNAASEAQDERGLHLIDRHGRVVTDLAAGLTDKGGPCQWVALKGGRMELFDFDTGRQVQTDYDRCERYSNDLSAVARQAKTRLLWGYLDRHGRLAIPCVFEAASRFRSGRALVIREGVPQIIATSGATIVETLWSLADDPGTSNIPARHGCVLVTITDTLTAEVWQRDCGPISLALRPALLIGSAAHCHICVPGLPPVAAVIKDIPAEDVLCDGYRLSMACDTPKGQEVDFLWEQDEFAISLELSHDEYAILQKGRDAGFLETGWRMEADDLWLWRNGDFARVCFHATAKGWSATRGWTIRRLRNHCEKYIVPMLEAAVGRRARGKRE